MPDGCVLQQRSGSFTSTAGKGIDAAMPDGCVCMTAETRRFSTAWLASPSPGLCQDDSCQELRTMESVQWHRVERCRVPVVTHRGELHWPILAGERCSGPVSAPATRGHADTDVTEVMSA